jgi:hypothetical protein
MYIGYFLFGSRPAMDIFSAEEDIEQGYNQCYHQRYYPGMERPGDQSADYKSQAYEYQIQTGIKAHEELH